MSSALKRYLVFKTDHYEPRGGWEDFVGSFDTDGDAVFFAKEKCSEHASCHVVDTWEPDINRPYNKLELTIRKEDGSLVPIDVVKFIFGDDSEEDE
jgi:hypothetical protein